MKRVFRLTLLAVIGFIFALTVQGQQEQYSFRQISIDQGLPGQNVRQVYQDYNGIIWISVEAIGLCRYDGRNFELFGNSSRDPKSISSNYVNSIIEDRDSNLWVATENGLNKYIRNSNKFKRYYTDSINDKSISSNIVNTLFVDRDTNLWVGTGNGLCRYNSNTDSFERIALQEKKTSLSINIICEHTSGDFYIGANRGLIQYNPKSKEVEQWNVDGISSNEPIHHMVRSISEDSKGNLWIATHRGINKFIVNTKTFEVWKFSDIDKEEFEDEGYNSQFSIDRRYIWFASYTSGIIIIDTETNTYQRVRKNIKFENGLKSNHIRSITQDRSGLLWISTKFEGVFIYDKRKEIFNKLPEKYAIFQPLKNMHILSFYQDTKEGVYWVGTKYNGLYKVDINANEIINYTHNIAVTSSIAGNRVHSIYRDSYGYLWVGLANGLDLLNEKTGVFKHINQIFIDDITQDVEGNLWVGTDEGVFVVDYRNFALERFSKVENKFFTDDAQQVLYIFTDKIGRVWFSTRFKGLYRYIPETKAFKYFSLQDPQTGKKSGAVRGVAEDILGNIWIGTKSDGVFIYNSRTDTFSYLTTDDGLPSNFILSIQQDKNFNFWFGTHNGLSYYNLSNKEFTNYTVLHGLQGNIFEVGVNGQFRDGYLLFGGHNGLNIFNPDNIDKHNIKVPDSVLVTSVKIADKEVLRDVNKNTTIELNHNQNYLSLEFILVDYFEPLRHSYRYRMLGISDKWVSLGNKNYVAFSGLQPGEYKFEIIGTNEFGVSSRQALAINFIINPPLIKTFWFRGLVLLVFIFIALLLIRSKLIRANKIRKYLELEIEERTEKLSRVNEELVAQNMLVEIQKQEIEENKNQLEDKVALRTKDLEIAKIKAEESDRLKSSFIANMSHEIRTPLNAILGFSSLIIDSEDEDENLSTYFESITANSDMLLKIIDDVLDISRLEAGQLDVEKRDFSLIALMTDVYNTINGQFDDEQKTAVKFFFENPLKNQEELILFTDEYRLRQILINLISNAVKFTKNGYIEFGFFHESENIKFYVKDTGIGINKDHYKTIFNRFNKIENTDVLYRGNGLGLSLSKDIVMLLGGEIWVESLFGHGSSFYFTIPSEKSYYINLPENNVDSGKKRIEILSDNAILIVEDEKSNYRFLAALLKNTDAQILWATNGLEAIEILEDDQESRIKLIFMDIKMPVLDGYQAFNRIRKLGLKIPIIAVTAYAQEKDKEKIIDFGFDDYLSKPIDKQMIEDVMKIHYKPNL